MTPECHPHDSGALASVNVMGNNIGKEELAKLQAVMKAHSTLQSLCGIAANAKEANLSGLGMDAADAAVLADDIHDNGALASLDISNNKLAQGEQDGYNKYGDPEYKTDLSGIIALADALKK